MDSIWIIVPAHNEEPVIGKVIEGLIKKKAHIVIIDDGSTDGTSAIAERYPVHLLRHPFNLGQGAALQTGIVHAINMGASYIVTFDADGQMDPDDIDPMLEPLIKKEADVVLGSRFLSSERPQMPTIRRIVLKMGTFFTHLTTGVKLTDAHNGFRALTRETAKKIILSHAGMAHASEFIYQIRSHDLRYSEVPVKIRYSPYSLQKGQKLIGALDILMDILLMGKKERHS